MVKNPEDLLPMLPTEGPPLPRGLGLKWPGIGTTENKPNPGSETAKEFCGFEDIKNPRVTAKIRARLKAGIRSEDFASERDRCYTEKELMDLTDKFIEVERAVVAGLPNELYNMLVLLTDAELSCLACRIFAIVQAIEGKDYAKKYIQEWTDDIKDNIDRLTKEELVKFENEMLMRGEPEG